MLSLWASSCKDDTLCANIFDIEFVGDRLNSSVNNMFGLKNTQDTFCVDGSHMYFLSVSLIALDVRFREVWCLNCMLMNLKDVIASIGIKMLEGLISMAVRPHK